MGIKVALTSTDGKFINTHFGRADHFYICELQEGAFQFLEERHAVPCCNDFEHELSSFEATAELLKDCTAVVASRVGAGAAVFLESRGFEVYEAPYLIEPVLEVLAKELGGIENAENQDAAR